MKLSWLQSFLYKEAIKKYCKNKNTKKDCSNFRHSFLFLLTELSSQAWRRAHYVSPEVVDIPANDLLVMNFFLWIPLRGLTTVGVENGTIVGKITNGRLCPIRSRNSTSTVINIRLLGLGRIELSSEEALRLPFGRKFRQTTLVNFVEHPNVHNW